MNLSAIRLAPFFVAAPSALTVRAGLTLGWSDTTWPVSPPGTVVTLCYQLNEAEGRMSLHRAKAGCSCITTTAGFRAAIFLTRAAVEEMFSKDTGSGATALREFAAGATSQFEHFLPPRGRLALESIRSCPFVGACRDMALTARCHDLLVEFLTAWSEGLRPAQLATIGPDDRVRLAAEILERDMGAPPSLADLAVQVGLSETTLKRNFPLVHGTTVFGYLRTRRMDEARRLLESGSATVLEAAMLVGYSNPSNFAAAFRRQFGVNPKVFQLTARRAQ